MAKRPPVYAAYFSLGFTLCLAILPVQAQMHPRETGGANLSGSESAISSQWIQTLGSLIQQSVSNVAGISYESQILLDLKNLNLLDVSNHSKLLPLIATLEQSPELRLTPEALQDLSSTERTHVLMEAIGETAVQSESRALKAERAAWAALENGEEHRLAENSSELARAQADIGIFLSRRTRERIETVRERIRAKLRPSQESRSAAARLTAMSLTDNFLSDIVDWRETDWRRLNQEVEKLRGLVESGEALVGEQGNIKFFTGGILSGLGEFKFGAHRRFRVIFRYLPREGRVALLKYDHRDNINPGTGAHSALQNWLRDDYLEGHVVEQKPLVAMSSAPKVILGKPIPALRVSAPESRGPRKRKRRDLHQSDGKPRVTLTKSAVLSPAKESAPEVPSPVRTEMMAQGAAVEPVEAEDPRSVAAEVEPIPRISLARAWKHSYDDWRDARALGVPLTSSDHWVLVVASFLTLFLWLPLFMAVSEIFRDGITFPRIILGGWWLSLAAKLYAENPAARLDDRLMSHIREFERETGWKIVLTRMPYLLAKVEPESRRVIMSVGWVVGSDHDAGKRRLAYLNDTLRRIRHAIQDIKK